MCYCIVISFTSIFEKHPTTLSDHRSCKTCPKDESNAQEAIRVFCITSKKTSAFKNFYCSQQPFVIPLSYCISVLKLQYQGNFFFYDVVLMNIFFKIHHFQPRHRHHQSSSWYVFYIFIYRFYACRFSGSSLLTNVTDINFYSRRRSMFQNLEE